MNKNQPKDMDKKRRLFEAAARLFAEKGFEKTTVDEIAEAAEVAKGTVYYHFKGKEELFLFLVEEGMAILMRRIAATLKNGMDCRVSLKKLIQVQLEFFAEYWDVCRIVLAEAWGTSTRQEKLQELLNEYYAIVGRIMEQGIRERVIRPQDKEVLCTALFGMTVLVALHFLQKSGPVDWARIEEQLETLFFRGVVIDTGNGKLL